MPNPKDMKKKTSFSIIYIFLALLIFSLLQLWLAPKVENVSYTQFKKLIADGKINSVVVSTKFLKGYEKVQDGKKEPLFPQLLYMTPRIDDRNLVDFLEKNNAEIIAENENTFSDDPPFLGASRADLCRYLALGHEENGPGDGYHDSRQEQGQDCGPDRRWHYL